MHASAVYISNSLPCTLIVISTCRYHYKSPIRLSLNRALSLIEFIDLAPVYPYTGAAFSSPYSHPIFRPFSPNSLPYSPFSHLFSLSTHTRNRVTLNTLWHLFRELLLLEQWALGRVPLISLSNHYIILDLHAFLPRFCRLNTEFSLPFAPLLLIVIWHTRFFFISWVWGTKKESERIERRSWGVW